jgi:GNAT superfamily N-acetyltransferase
MSGGDEVALRDPRPGELSWLQWRHMVTVAPLYGWDQRYEAEIAQLVGKYLGAGRGPDDRFWIAVRGEQVLGCVGFVRETPGRGRLRLLYVEPDGRGLGLGHRLVAACLDHAQALGCGEVVLWTVDVLVAARKIYAEAGFVLEHSEMTDALGAPCMDESWRVVLAEGVPDRGGHGDRSQGHGRQAPG